MLANREEYGRYIQQWGILGALKDAVRVDIHVTGYLYPVQGPKP